MNSLLEQLATHADFHVGNEYSNASYEEQQRLWAENFAESILNEIEQVIHDLYHALPLEQAAVLLTLKEQIESRFYGV